MDISDTEAILASASPRNPKVSIEKKMWAAKEAAPFVHSKLASVNKTISGDEDKPIAVTIGWRKKK